MSKQKQSRSPSTDELIAGRLKDKQLVDAVKNPGEALLPQEALKELSRRRSGKAPALMAAVLTNKQNSSELRATAAVELGKRNAASGRKALVASLGTEDLQVRRRVIEALGRVGNEEALQYLSKLRPRTEPLKRSLAFARQLISCRLGLDRYSIEAPKKRSLLRLEAESSIALRPVDVPTVEIEKMADVLKRLLPAIPVSFEGGKYFSCDNNRFLILLVQKVRQRKTLTPLTRHQAVVSLLLKRSQATHGYYVYEYILTQPMSDRGVEVFGIRPSGHVTHYGTGKVDAGSAQIALKTVNTPYSPPLELNMSYHSDSREMKFGSARLNGRVIQAGKHSKAPSRIIAPVG